MTSWLPKSRVLVPFDFSDYAVEAIETGLQMVESPDKVNVVYVLPTPHPADPAVLFDSESEREDRVHTTLLEHLKAAKLDKVTVHVRTGNAGNEIASLAEDLDVELIVMPSHGRRGVKRVLLGSVAERVVRIAHCPVLILRRPEK